MALETEACRQRIITASSLVHSSATTPTERQHSDPWQAIKSFSLLLILVFGPFIVLLALICSPLHISPAVTLATVIIFAKYTTYKTRHEINPGVHSCRPMTQQQARIASAMGQFENYRPPMWLLDGNWSTMLPYLLFFNAIEIPLERQWIMADDGCYIALDWHLPSGDIKGVILVLPGLLGGSRSNYVRDLMLRMATRGYAVCALVGRGVSDTPMFGPPQSVFHNARVTDVYRAFESVESIVKGHSTPIYLFGYSAGGIRAVNFAAIYGKKLVGRLAACVSFSGMLRMEVNGHFKLSREVYQPLMVHATASHFLRKTTLVTSPTQAGRIPTCRTLREFDEKITVPLLGYTSADAYYDDMLAGCNDKWQNISIPTLCVHACDDPVIHVDSALCPDIVAGNSNITYLVTANGGHLGWLTGSSLDKHGWKWIADVGAAFFLAAK